MRRKVLSALALTSVVALSLEGVAQANTHRVGNDYSESKGWHLVNDRTVFKVGEVCSGKVIFRYRGHERTLVKGAHGYKPLLSGDQFAPGPGDKFISEAGNDVRFSLYAPDTEKTVRRHASGDFFQTVSGDGRDLRVVAKGSNLYFGYGTSGLLWTDGLQRFEVADFAEKSATFNNFRIRNGDPQQQLCDKLGLDPVQT